MEHDMTDLVKGFLFAPVETFGTVKGTGIGDALKYFLVILLINIILSSIVTLVIASTAFTVIEQVFSGLGIAMPLAAGAGIIIWAVIMVVLMILFAFIAGAWLHLWVYVLGGRRGYAGTMKAVLYGATPYMCIGWIPIIGPFVGGLWSVVVEILGIRELHGISTGRAVAAYLAAVIVLFIILVLIASYFVIATVTVTPAGPA
ncbi:MAG TPA: YIP1 family protein [Methanoregulaceae archaeon]|nr:YIP1 family protein [Methanolinea sp.]MCC7567372.1 YIP1 family protein [Methanoregulaceae archaeon]MDD3091957.1 YIP1 family protein [Methanoregulaceae archaeon]MDD5049324.1 YIP1 family protein [Methanoregulaceae archaeon]MDD5685466.1 YIP1 family protein [Methanoregulaceae archaeon]